MTQADPQASGRTTVTKADIAQAVHARVGGFSKRESAEFVEQLFGLLKDSLRRREKVKLSGFGNFNVRPKKARVGRNPVTGEEIEISARHVVTFKASPVLKELVNGPDVDPAEPA
jgi:integration host factor subunit alpha